MAGGFLWFPTGIPKTWVLWLGWFGPPWLRKPPLCGYVGPKNPVVYQVYHVVSLFYIL
jgi:hypothetical protein